MQAFLWLVPATIIVVLIIAVRMYRAVFLPAVDVAEGEQIILYIPSDADYDWLNQRLDEENIISDKRAFEWLANKKNLKNHVKPGRY
ncbi:MAG: hypothetical protein ACOCZL_00790, partial [Bacteroidota bacterium]